MTDNNTTFHKVTITPYSGTDYARLDFDDTEGETMAAIVAHHDSNPVEKIIDDEPYMVRYHHEDMTMPYVTNSTGKLVGRIDIPLGRDHTQIQIEHADLVMKGNGCNIILRSEGSNFFKLKVSDTGELSTEPFDRDDIIWASTNYTVVEE